ncbi:MAG TPA: MIP/aquaporin family protein [Rubrobacteraceae bacterium]|jgi:glycerol uptake facilitator protein|nr:MIP/aquaporin family protein [Rubrobacteraceae bacterium]
MEAYLGEFIGTMLLIILGDGVVAGVLLRNSKAENSGWIVITLGWGMAVAVAVYCTVNISGAFINPAVVLGFAVTGDLEWALVPGYIIAEFLGAFVGAVIVWLAYLPHWEETADPGLKLGVFSTAPAIYNTPANIICEIIGTFVLVFGVFGILANDLATGLFPLLVGFLVLGIGLSLGGPTGYAINPARDLGPRIAHAVLPIAGKGGSDWGYAWIPVVAPIIGGILGALAFTLLFG